MALPALLRADDLLRLDIPSRRTELVRGRLIVREPAGSWHGAVSLELAVLPALHVEDVLPGFRALLEDVLRS